MGHGLPQQVGVGKPIPKPVLQGDQLGSLFHWIIFTRRCGNLGAENRTIAALYATFVQGTNPNPRDIPEMQMPLGLIQRHF
jgi:hypothetical protein